MTGLVSANASCSQRPRGQVSKKQSTLTKHPHKAPSQSRLTSSKAIGRLPGTPRKTHAAFRRTLGSMRRILPPSAGITSSRPLLLLLPLPRCRVNTPSAYLSRVAGRVGRTQEGVRPMQDRTTAVGWLSANCGFHCFQNSAQQLGTQAAITTYSESRLRRHDKPKGVSKALNCWAATEQGRAQPVRDTLVCSSSPFSYSGPMGGGRRRTLAAGDSLS